MPIRKDGTDEHEHFKTLFEEYLRPLIEEHGYQVLRADSLSRGGAISRDVIIRLAEAELVIADLTDLNPNVYYELGVRHALRGRGTLMVLDMARTPDIPFDLAAYRVIQFSSTMEGLTKLRRDLRAFVKGMQDTHPHADNPVHDWLPALPLDLLASSQGSTEGKLREDLAHAEAKLRQFEERFGQIFPSENTDTAFQRAIAAAAQELASGAMPAELMRRAADARLKRDVGAFLRVLEQAATTTPGRISADQWNNLARYAENLGLEPIVGPIYEQARRIFPEDASLRNSQLTSFAHSKDRDLRARARDEFMREFGIRIDEDGAHINQLPAEPSWKFGVMLDAFHRDKMHSEALQIASAFLQAFPDRTIPVRNYARALDNADRAAESLKYYELSVECLDVDDGSWSWFGSELFNRKWYVRAAMAYCRAAILDPGDATYYARTAQCLSWALLSKMQGRQSADDAPMSLSPQIVEEFVHAAVSCDAIDQNDIEMAENAAHRVGVRGPAVLVRAAQTGDGHTGDRRLTLRERLDLATRISHEADRQSERGKTSPHDAL